jgi:glutathione peroxidase
VSGLHDFTLPALEGPPIRLAAWAGSPVLLALLPDRGPLDEPHLALEAIWQQFRGAGLRMVGLPCLPIQGTERESGPDLSALCHALSFPVAAPLELTGPARHALARWLTGPGSPFPGEVRADFEKFLCDGLGRLVCRYPGALGAQAPELVAAIEMLLP